MIQEQYGLESSSHLDLTNFLYTVSPFKMEMI